MDWAALGTLGALLAGVGTLTGGLFTWVGKRGENAVTGYSSLTDDLQEERANLKKELLDTSTALAQEAAARAHAEAENARLRDLVIRLGGDPS